MMKQRKCARAIIINEAYEVLLERFEFPTVIGDKVLWVTPGGGLEEGETYEQALERELFEELGIKVTVREKPVFIKDVEIEGKEESFISHEVYYLVPIEKKQCFTTEHMTINEKSTYHGMRWWTYSELSERKDFAPKELINYLK